MVQFPCGLEPWTYVKLANASILVQIYMDCQTSQPETIIRRSEDPKFELTTHKLRG